MHQIPERFKNEPRVTLGGEEWAIPPLSGRRIIMFGSLATGLAIKHGMPYEDMMKVYEAVFCGVQQGIEKDSLTFDDWLDNYSVTFNELLAALPTIGKQAGMEMAAAKPGEVKAEGARPFSPDGTTS